MFFLFFRRGIFFFLISSEGSSTIASTGAGLGIRGTFFNASERCRNSVGSLEFNFL